MIKKLAQFAEYIKLMEQIKKLYQKTKDALLFTHKNNSNRSIDMIKQVQISVKQLRKSHPDLQKELDSIEIISLNNLACAFNRKNKYRASLYYLQLASAIQSELYSDIDECALPQALHQVATTHSNMCAVLSQLGDHQKALKQISRAIQLLLKTQQTKKSDALIVFYYNCTVQLQYLNRLNEAQKMAERGYILSTANKQMESKFVTLIDKLNEKIKKRQQKIGKMIMNNIRNRNGSISDEKSIGRRGNSLNYISNVTNDYDQPSKPIIKQYKKDRFGSKNQKIKLKLTNYRSVNRSEYPTIKLPHFVENMKQQQRNMGQTLGLQQRKKIMTLYEPKKHEDRIPKQQRISLKKKQKTLQILQNYDMV